jgi:ferritin
MLSKEMESALNKQINAEMFSAYLYLSMAAYFESISLDGFAKWMEAQAMEEMAHAKKFYDFVSERGGRILLDAIEKPKTDWTTMHDLIVFHFSKHLRSQGHATS